MPPKRRRAATPSPSSKSRRRGKSPGRGRSSSASSAADAASESEGEAPAGGLSAQLSDALVVRKLCSESEALRAVFAGESLKGALALLPSEGDAGEDSGGSQSQESGRARWKSAQNKILTKMLADQRAGQGRSSRYKSLRGLLRDKSDADLLARARFLLVQAPEK